jgi:hypothetical protein
MPRLLTACLALALLAALPLTAQAAQSDLETGFDLGRYSTTALHVAYELTYMQTLIDEVHPLDITDEALSAGKVTEQDATMAQSAMVYAIWRIQFFLDTMLESVRSTDSFADPALADLKAPTLAVMDDIQKARDAFFEEPDLTKLAAFGQAIKDGDFVTQLITLAEQAAQKAGVSVME